MNTLKLICLLSLLLVLASCDTFYRAYLINDSNESVTVISNSEINMGNPNLLKFEKEMDNQFYYELVANSEYVLAAGIDMPVTEDSFPSDTLIIISAIDTLQFNSKAEMLAAMIIVTDQRMELRVN